MSTKREANGEKWATAALRISSATLSVEEITAAIGRKPTRSFDRGQPVNRRNPQRLRTQSVWILESPTSQGDDLASHLCWLLDFAESRLDALRTLHPKCKADLFCGFSSESGQGLVVLDSKLLDRLAKLALDLKLDLYPSGQASRTLPLYPRS
jgi:hypothetical protein